MDDGRYPVEPGSWKWTSRAGISTCLAPVGLAAAKGTTVAATTTAAAIVSTILFRVPVRIDPPSVVAIHPEERSMRRGIRLLCAAAQNGSQVGAVADSPLPAASSSERAHAVVIVVRSRR